MFVSVLASVCFLGNRTLSFHAFPDGHCAKKLVQDSLVLNETTMGPGPTENTTDLWAKFCKGPELDAPCDDYFAHSNTTTKSSIPGLASGIITGT